MKKEVALIMSGYRLMSNPLLTDTRTREVPRTWKERLFTHPWRPLKKTRTESYQVPSRQVIVIAEHRVMVAHPVMVKEIEQLFHDDFSRFNPFTSVSVRGLRPTFDFSGV